MRAIDRPYWASSTFSHTLSAHEAGVTGTAMSVLILSPLENPFYFTDKRLGKSPIKVAGPVVLGGFRRDVSFIKKRRSE